MLGTIHFEKDSNNWKKWILNPFETVELIVPCILSMWQIFYHRILNIIGCFKCYPCSSIPLPHPLQFWIFKFLFSSEQIALRYLMLFGTKKNINVRFKYNRKCLLKLMLIQFANNEKKDRQICTTTIMVQW